MVEKYEKNLLEKVMEMEYKDISDLMDNRPLELDYFALDDFGLEFEGGGKHGLP